MHRDAGSRAPAAILARAVVKQKRGVVVENVKAFRTNG